MWAVVPAAAFAQTGIRNSKGGSAGGADRSTRADTALRIALHTRARTAERLCSVVPSIAVAPRSGGGTRLCGDATRAQTGPSAACAVAIAGHARGRTAQGMRSIVPHIAETQTHTRQCVGCHAAGAQGRAGAGTTLRIAGRTGPRSDKRVRPVVARQAVTALCEREACLCGDAGAAQVCLSAARTLLVAGLAGTCSVQRVRPVVLRVAVAGGLRGIGIGGHTPHAVPGRSAGGALAAAGHTGVPVEIVACGTGAGTCAGRGTAGTPAHCTYRGAIHHTGIVIAGTGEAERAVAARHHTGRVVAGAATAAAGKAGAVLRYGNTRGSAAGGRAHYDSRRAVGAAE